LVAADGRAPEMPRIGEVGGGAGVAGGNDSDEGEQMPSHEESRRSRFLERLAERGLAGALVSDQVNIRYLTGFTGSSAALLLLQGEPAVLVTDGRYVEQAADETGLEPRLVKGDPVTGLWSRAHEIVGDEVWSGVPRLGVETDSLSHDRYQRLASQEPGVELMSLDGLVQELRTVKDEQEIAALREACSISTLALEQLVSGEVLGRTERQLARALEAAMHDLGAEAVGFPTILASGPHSAIPHHTPTDRQVERGDLLKIDFGARVRGYHADCTRTFVAGSAPSGWQVEIHEAVRLAQAVGVEHCSPGAATADVDAAVVESLRGAGLADRFVHGLGHGVGLEIHEDPFLGSTSTGMLGDCTAITIEPGVYLPGRGGVRIEDTLVVRDGGPEVLTTAARGLRVVG
jgi:Xaa-Pro aminopeptidase